MAGDMEDADPGGNARSSGAASSFLRVLTVALAVGVVVGGVVGGIGGRVAMRILAVTSDDNLKGLLTDDEEEVGKITLDGTLGLIIFIAILGVLLALLYLVLRRWLPARRGVRALAFAGLLWAVQGADMFDPDGFDFTQLEPHWLAVVMFSAILLGAGALTSFLIDWASAHWPDPRPGVWYAYVPLLLLVPLFPLLLPIIVVAVAVWLGNRFSSLGDLWRSRVVTILGAVALIAVGAIFGMVTLLRVADILG